MSATPCIEGCGCEGAGPWVREIPTINGGTIRVWKCPDCVNLGRCDA
jgi:hypothetical protein